MKKGLNTIDTAENLTLEIRRVIKAKRERVFNAWTNPERLEKWFAPGEMRVASEVESPFVGGSYTEIVPNERLCFTWGWPDSIFHETTVIVEFRDVAECTEILIRHKNLANKAMFTQHEYGWLGCLANLEKYLALPDDRHFSRRLSMSAPRSCVYDALATADGISSWWATRVKNPSSDGTPLRLEFEGLQEYIELRVDELKAPTTVLWTCLKHTALPEWAETTMSFELLEHTKDKCELNFVHFGLTPSLTCYDHCEIGWYRFLDSLKSFAETGHGMPYRA